MMRVTQAGLVLADVSMVFEEKVEGGDMRLTVAFEDSDDSLQAMAKRE